MKIIKSILLAVTFSMLTLCAADVAFYPFTDGQNGQNALDVTLNNDVDSAVLSGTVTRTGTDATASFLDDIPGSYLYTNSTWSAETLYRSDVYGSIQTTWVTNMPKYVVSGSSAVFSGLGAKLSELDEWTVEFFFKLDELLTANYQQNVVFGDSENIKICIENKYDNGPNASVRVFCGDVLTRATSCNLSWDGKNGKLMTPGLWHHMAVSYKRSERLVKAILDYTHYEGSGTVVCTNKLVTPSAFYLGNSRTAARFAALRVTDRVLSASEYMRASAMPPNIVQSSEYETRFHWSFERDEPGALLGTVQNDVSWALPLYTELTNQYTYAIDKNPSFANNGEGVAKPQTVTYTNEYGTMVIGAYASNVTLKTQSVFEMPDGSFRPNNVCAFIKGGPKYASGNIFGYGFQFRMSSTNLLTSSDFTVETYFKPDIEGWNAILGNDSGGRYRASIFGVKGQIRDDVQNKISINALWCLHMNMNDQTFNFNAAVVYEDGTFGEYQNWSTCKGIYDQVCNDGKMHHYAVVYRVSDSENENKPTVRLFIDRTEYHVFTLPAPLIDHGMYCKDVFFALGAQELNNHPMQGWFDEVRYTVRALAPTEFLRLRPPSGTLLLFR